MPLLSFSEMENTRSAAPLLRVRTSPLLQRKQPDAMRSKLRLSRDLIKQGNPHAALTDAERRFQTAQDTIPLPVLRYHSKHRKTRSEVLSCFFGGSSRALEVSRDRRLNKAYLVPSKPVLLPFAERCYSTSRTIVSTPQSRSSPVSKPQSQQLSRTPLFTIGAQPKDGSHVATDRTVWSQQSLSGLINSLKRSKSVTYKQ